METMTITENNLIIVQQYFNPYCFSPGEQMKFTTNRKIHLKGNHS